MAKRDHDGDNGGGNTPAKRARIDTTDGPNQTVKMEVVTKKSVCDFQISSATMLAALKRSWVDLSKLQHDVVVESPSGVQVTWGVKLVVNEWARWKMTVNLKSISHDMKVVCCKINCQFPGQGDNLVTSVGSRNIRNCTIGWRHNFDIIKPEDIGNIVAADGSLSVKFTFEIYEVITTADKVKPLEEALAELKTKAAEKWTDFMKKLDNENEANEMIKIVSSDGVETTIRQSLLTAHSQVFKAMMRVPMVEAETKTVNLRDISGKTLNVLRHYFYTGELAAESLADIELVHEMTNAAAMYMLDDLLTFFDSHLGQICSTEAAYHLLGLTHNLGLKQAEKDIMELINKNIAGP